MNYSVFTLRRRAGERTYAPGTGRGGTEGGEISKSGPRRRFETEGNPGQGARWPPACLPAFLEAPAPPRRGEGTNTRRIKTAAGSFATKSRPSSLLFQMTNEYERGAPQLNSFPILTQQTVKFRHRKQQYRNFRFANRASHASRSKAPDTDVFVFFYTQRKCRP